MFSSAGPPTSTILALGLGLCAACGGAPDPRTIAGDHFSIVVPPDFDGVLCGGSLAHLDRYIERVFEFLGAPIPSDFDVPVYLVPEHPGFVDGRTGYFDGEVVYVRSLSSDFERALGTLRHEVTHAIIKAVWGESVDFLNEGIAEGLSRSMSLVSEEVESPPILEMLDRDWQDLDYLGAARFTRFLVANFGVEAFRRLFQQAKGATLDELRLLFPKIYTYSIEDLEAAYLDDVRRCTMQLEICDADAAETVGSGWSARYSPRCEDALQYGAVSPDGGSRFSQQWTLEIARAGDYRLRSFAGLVFTRCGACEDQVVDHLSLGTDVVLSLSPGYYTIEILFGSVSDAEFSLELVSVSGDVSPH